MICPVCGSRWSPRRKDKWKQELTPFTLIPINNDALKEFFELYDNDTKVPCGNCSI
jgi:hypothetical protein